MSPVQTEVFSYLSITFIVKNRLTPNKYRCFSHALWHESLLPCRDQYCQHLHRLKKQHITIRMLSINVHIVAYAASCCLAILSIKHLGGNGKCICPHIFLKSKDRSEDRHFSFYNYVNNYIKKKYRCFSCAFWHE